MNKNPILKEHIRNWWADFPMTYGDEHGNTHFSKDNITISPEFQSKEFFEKSDDIFYSWNLPLHGDKGKFSRLFDYQNYKSKEVLEVGCGLGCMAMNWAEQGAKITAVDLNPTSVSQTKTRFSIFGLQGDIRECDAEHLPFEDSQFDYVYSWGVLHHTPGTRKAISEIKRVLKPGGKVGIMLYNRESLLYRFVIKWQEGFVNMERNWLSELELASRYSDGERKEGNPHTWPVTKEEIRNHLFNDFASIETQVLGTDVRNILNIWSPNLGTRLENSGILKEMANRWGWSLWTTAENQKVIEN